MAKKITIGIIYSYDENWIGGTYYIENLVNSFSLLRKALQPTVWLFNYSSLSEDQVRDRFNYQDILIINVPPYTWWRKLLVRMSRIFKFFTFFLYGRPNQLDLTFPNPYLEAHDLCKRRVYWVPDMQEAFLPELFGEVEIARRRDFHLNLIENNLPIVFSSQCALKDFENHYNKPNVMAFRLPFAVTLPMGDGALELTSLRKEFNLGGAPYFICSNQFWKHKNHTLVLEAMAILSEEFPTLIMVFTGQPRDTRNLEYYASLQDLVRELKLQKNVRFLGFIDRKAQLSLMKYAKAVVQPSLFEGWSTVVEDAKALNKEIILSDIPVHREQLSDDELFSIQWIKIHYHWP
ncbi:MAG: glycosyltransferase [Vicingaceae bacterium]